jgi:hypothetical protein
MVKEFIQVFAPNAFTPGPGGEVINNKWFAYTRAVEDLTVAVYNRWGEQVYYTDELIAPGELESEQRRALGNLLEGIPNYKPSEARVTRPWDGTDQNDGQAAEQGVYMYNITALYEGKEYRFSGTVTLIR